MQKKLRDRIKNIAGSNSLTFFVLVLILVGGLVVRLYKINNPVADWHSWRQADTASVSRTFVEEGVDLLHPRYHDISKIQTGYENPEGYRYVEFPFYNFVHAALYRSLPLFSLEVWGRLVSIFSALGTTFFLFLIGNRYGRWVGLGAAFFYAFLPFNVYFTRTILPDPMAVSFGLGSVYFFMSYAETKRVFPLFVSSFFLSLAILVKPHAVFFGVPIAYLALRNFSLEKLVKNKWLYLALDVVLVPFLLWRIWMYQEELLRGIAHWGWSFNGNGIRFKPSFWRWIFGERVGRLILGTWGVLPFGVGVFAGKKLSVIHAFLLGAFLYFSVFASANVMHDYYQMFIIPAISLALGMGVHTLWANKTFQPIVTKLGLVAVILFMFAFSFYDIRDNYRINDTGILIAGRAAREVLPAGAKVIAPYNGDTTFLYQTGRWGWPAVTTSIEKMIDLGADYYISVNLSDRDTLEYRQKFAEVESGEGYVILDLHKKI